MDLRSKSKRLRAKPGYIYSEGTGRGWISPKQPIQDAYENDKWNQYLVRAMGDRIQVWINGRKIEDLSDAESSREGFIGLQVHGIGKGQGPFQVRWKNIKVRQLLKLVPTKSFRHHR